MATARRPGIWPAAIRTAAPPRLWPTRIDGGLPSLVIALPAATRSSTSAAKVVSASFHRYYPIRQSRSAARQCRERRALVHATGGEAVLAAREAVGEDGPATRLAVRQVQPAGETVAVRSVKFEGLCAHKSVSLVSACVASMLCQAVRSLHFRPRRCGFRDWICSIKYPKGSSRREAMIQDRHWDRYWPLRASRRHCPGVTPILSVNTRRNDDTD